MSSIKKQSNDSLSQQSDRNPNLLMTHTHEQLAFCNDGQWRTATNYHKLEVIFEGMPAFQLGINALKDENISLWLDCTKGVSEEDFEEGISEAVKFFDANNTKITLELTPAQKAQHTPETLSTVEKIVAKFNNT